MNSMYVSMDEFKKLETKVNQILEVHSLDKELTVEEKQLVVEAKMDLKNKRANFVSLDKL